jgi:hypothetical protein
MALPPVTKVVISFDVCHWLARQAQGLGRVERRCGRRFAIRQTVQNVDDMGFGGDTRLKRQFDGA